MSCLYYFKLSDKKIEFGGGLLKGNTNRTTHSISEHRVRRPFIQHTSSIHINKIQNIRAREKIKHLILGVL